MNFQRMTDLDLAGKRVLIREDLNVPVKNGEITSDARLRAALPTIKAALAQGAAVMVCSHLGRPVEGEAQRLAAVDATALGKTIDLAHAVTPSATACLSVAPAAVTEGFSPTL